MRFVKVFSARLGGLAWLGEPLYRNGRSMISQKPVKLLVACGISLALWMVFAKFMAPALIGIIYRGESFSLLNSAIKGQAEFSLDHYLQKWDRMAMTVLWTILAFWLLAIITSSQLFFDRFVGTATPGKLGATRMWICFILLIGTLWENLPSFALLPLELREDMGIMKIFDEVPIGFEQFLTSALSLGLFQWTTIALLFLAMIGWRTRIVVPLAAFCSLILNGVLREYSGFWHQNLVPIYVLVILSFVPCGDGWSVDRLRKVSRGEPVADPDQSSSLYGWSRYICWVAIAWPYFAAGLTKLRASGFDWWSAVNMRSLVYEQTLYPRAGNWSIALSLQSAPDLLFVLLGIAGSLGEAIMILTLFSRSFRKVYPAVMIFMHVGIVFLMNIVFLDLMLVLLVFYDFSSVLKKIARRLYGEKRLEVLYDGLCPLCRRTVRVLTCLDLFDRLDLQDFRHVDIAGYNRRNNLHLRAEDLEKEMYVVSGERALSGFYGYRAIALVVPIFWPIVPFLFIPGASALGRVVYQIIARNRLKLLACEASCPVGAAEQIDFIPVMSSRRHNVPFGFVFAGLIAVMGSIWIQSKEYYPLTAMPMFANARNSVVTYFRTLGHRESGAVSVIYLEDSIDALSINGRYESLFDYCFRDTPRDLEVCEKTFAALSDAYNKKIPAKDKVAQFEIQRRKWDFVADPKDSNYGALDARMIYDVSSGKITK